MFFNDFFAGSQLIALFIRKLVLMTKQSFFLLECFPQFWFTHQDYVEYKAIFIKKMILLQRADFNGRWNCNIAAFRRDVSCEDFYQSGFPGSIRANQPIMALRNELQVGSAEQDFSAEAHR